MFSGMLNYALMHREGLKGVIYGFNSKTVWHIYKGKCQSLDSLI